MDLKPQEVTGLLDLDLRVEGSRILVASPCAAEVSGPCGLEISRGDEALGFGSQS